MRLLLRLVTLVVVISLVYLGVTFVQVVAAGRRDGARPAQAIVVLGAAQYDGTPSPVLQARLDHAAALYVDGLAPVVVVTGGRQEGDRFTEASAAANYLQQAGVPEDALRLETQGESSWQSLAAAARFLRNEGIDDVVLVSSRFHALRIGEIADEVGLDAAVSPAPGSGQSFVASIPAYGRETFGVALGRIIGYRRLVNLDHRVGEVRQSVRAD